MNRKALSKQRREHLKELFIKYIGYISFCLFFAVASILIFKFLPEDAPINNEYAIKKNKNTEEWQAANILDPAAYHLIAADHKNTKSDKGLELYRNEDSKESVVWFYNQITKNPEVTRAILENANSNSIPLSLAFSLAFVESCYRPTVTNSNSNKSIDRGLYQLNNRSFPELTESDFYDPYVSAKYGLSHLRYCLNVAGNEVSALAMYNAGATKVRSGKTPESTLNYVSNILNYREGLDKLFNTQVAIFFDFKDENYLALSMK
ncbi:MAG: transglycosylase SLT domain-containing protein [Treponemataceae bacterium]|nr:transglycosylase SLT domain-containing protein [Spirochaetales bacterium]MDY6030737.1 transglycosylase SLT domain-containing protein [Treponemataceae bacterium]